MLYLMGLCFTGLIWFSVQTIMGCLCLLNGVRAVPSQWISLSVPTYCTVVPAAEHFQGTQVSFFWVKLGRCLLGEQLICPSGYSVSGNKLVLAWSLQNTYCGYWVLVSLYRPISPGALFANVHLPVADQMLEFLDLWVAMSSFPL